MQFYFVHTLHNTYIAVLFCHLRGIVWGKQDLKFQSRNQFSWFQRLCLTLWKIGKTFINETPSEDHLKSSFTASDFRQTHLFGRQRSRPESICQTLVGCRGMFTQQASPCQELWTSCCKIVKVFTKCLLCLPTLSNKLGFRFLDLCGPRRTCRTAVS